MQVINTVSDKYFTLNGTQYAKIYQPLKSGTTSIGLHSIYISKRLLGPVNYSEYIIDGVVPSSQADAVAALLPVVFEFKIPSEIDSLIDSKLEAGTYTGTGADLKEAVDSIQFTGVTTYQTLALLNAVDPVPATGTAAKVANDPTASNNGYYSVVAGAWVKDADLYEATVDAGNTSKGVTGAAVSDYGAALNTSLLFGVNDIDSRVDFREIALYGADPDTTYYLHRFSNWYDNVDNLRNEILIEITDAPAGTVVCRFIDYGGASTYTGIRRVKFVELSGSGVTGEAVINFTAALGMTQTVFGYPIKLEHQKSAVPPVFKSLDQVPISNPYELTSVNDKIVASSLYDFWIDDLTAVANKSFKIRGLYKNDGSFTDRFGVRVVETVENLWSATSDNTIVWDNINGLTLRRMPYNGTYLNFIWDADKVAQIGTDDAMINVLKKVDTPNTPEGFTLRELIYVDTSLSTSGKSLAALGDSIVMGFSTQSTDHDTQDWASLKDALQLGELINCGIGGSTWQDRGDINITDTPIKATATGTASNCVRMLERLVSEGRTSPDIILMAYGTNGSTVDGDFSAIMSMTFAALEADEAARETFYGGMRYAIERASNSFPDARIILFTPPQAVGSGRNYTALKAAGDAIKIMGSRYSAPVVDLLSDLGIRDMHEIDGSNGRYLSDGTHLNSAGKTLYTNFAAVNILNL